MSGAAHCALGFTVHTGWAACVVAAGTVHAPRTLARALLEAGG